MTSSTVDADEPVLAVDVGATTIKFGLVDAEGELVGEVRRCPTPYPCSPPRLVDLITEQIAVTGASRVGVGFPGALADGLVLEPGNLSRPEGFTSPIDPALHEEWLNIDLQAAMRRASQCDVRVVNDATLAALGCSTGHGVELVFTLGTGFGIALVVDGSLKPIRDVGAEVFADDETYDRAFGDHARSNGEERWNERLVRAVDGFVDEFAADTVHLGGGNSRRVDLDRFAKRPYQVIVSDNDATLRGAIKLFDR
jgi:polyphosphate glucokinase